MEKRFTSFPGWEFRIDGQELVWREPRLSGVKKVGRFLLGAGFFFWLGQKTGGE